MTLRQTLDRFFRAGRVDVTEEHQASVSKYLRAFQGTALVHLRPARQPRGAWLTVPSSGGAPTFLGRDVELNRLGKILGTRDAPTTESFLSRCRFAKLSPRTIPPLRLAWLIVSLERLSPHLLRS